MQTGEWLKPGALNTIHYSIKLPDGSTKTGALRFTKSQQERFQALQKAEGNIEYTKIAEVAMNPKHEEPEFTAEQLEEIFDMDQITLLASVWLERKVGNPRLSPELDPKFFA
jgi:hypothetical protein